MDCVSVIKYRTVPVVSVLTCIPMQCAVQVSCFKKSRLQLRIKCLTHRAGTVVDKILFLLSHFGEPPPPWGGGGWQRWVGNFVKSSWISLYFYIVQWREAGTYESSPIRMTVTQEKTIFLLSENYFSSPALVLSTNPTSIADLPWPVKGSVYTYSFIRISPVFHQSCLSFCDPL